MEAINILVGIVLIVSMAANAGAAKRGFKLSVSNSLEKPKTYLQKVPLNISALVVVLILIGVFNIGTLEFDQYSPIRLIGLFIYVIFSWFQFRSFKTLGENYTQEIGIFKKHKLVQTGLYKYMRHPQYLSQILCDIGAGLALMSYLVLPVAILIELPLFILRAKEEEKLFEKHFSEEFKEYKKKSGFMIPFIG